jgi:uncharacterized protein (TIGR03437 family)
METTRIAVCMIITQKDGELKAPIVSKLPLCQLNFTVPAGLGSGDVPLEVIAGGMRTPSGAVISLQ